MAASKLVTTVSTKGQVILPKVIRDRRNWDAGTELVVEDTEDGVLLKSSALFPQTEAKDVYASLPRPARPKSLKEMQAGIAVEAKRRHARNRY
jgi:AbrB family looped-hinge helix DNA binding protein